MSLSSSGGNESPYNTANTMQRSREAQDSGDMLVTDETSTDIKTKPTLHMTPSPTAPLQMDSAPLYDSGSVLQARPDVSARHVQYRGDILSEGALSATPLISQLATMKDLLQGESSRDDVSAEMGNGSDVWVDQDRIEDMDRGSDTDVDTENAQEGDEDAYDSDSSEGGGGQRSRHHAAVHAKPSGSGRKGSTSYTVQAQNSEDNYVTFPNHIAGHGGTQQALSVPEESWLYATQSAPAALPPPRRTQLQKLQRHQQQAQLLDMTPPSSPPIPRELQKQQQELHDLHGMGKVVDAKALQRVQAAAAARRLQKWMVHRLCAVLSVAMRCDDLCRPTYVVWDI